MTALVEESDAMNSKKQKQAKLGVMTAMIAGLAHSAVALSELSTPFKPVDRTVYINKNSHEGNEERIAKAQEKRLRKQKLRLKRV